MINPDGWFGKTWLLELGGSYTPLFLIVEADTMSDAIDELSDNETYGHQIHVCDSDLGDYPENDRHYDGSGRVIDLDHLMIHGQERSDVPFPVSTTAMSWPPKASTHGNSQTGTRTDTDESGTTTAPCHE